MPKVSFIIPAWNAGKYIREALTSLQTQAYSDFEAIVIDDSSTDDTGDIIKEFQAKDPRFIYMTNKYEKGIVGGLNTALEASTGEYIARFDSDDISRSYRLEMQVDFMDRNLDIMVSGGGFAPFNEDGHTYDIYHPGNSVELAWRYITNAYLCHPTVIFRREIFEEFGGYPKEKSEDFVYFSKIIRKYKFTNLQKILIEYRVHQTNLSKVNATGISDSVKNAFESNYKFYIPSGRGMKLFYDFQELHKVRFKNIPKLMILNILIINRIRKNYSKTLFDIEFLKALYKANKLVVRYYINKQ